MSAYLISGGTLVDQSGVRSGDLRVRDGVIVEVGQNLEIQGDEELVNASGAHVMSGLVDLHTHLREPGGEEAETITTGSRGAALGGYTAIIAMPNTTPTIDSPSMVRDMLALAQNALCEVIPAAAMTVGRRGELLTPMGELAAMGVRMFTDVGNGVQNPAMMRSIMEYATGLHAVTGGQRLVLAQHCEVEALSAGGHMHEGEWSSRLGIGGQPTEAETLMMLRDFVLAKRTGAHVHVQHVSTAEGVELIRQAKADGLRVTAEAAPQHFTLTHAACASYDPVFKVNPPLRTEIDREAVIAGLIDGTIDAIATNHAPHEPHTKEFPFDQAPAGMLGLETALALTLTKLDLPIEQVAALMSWNPARIAGIDDRHGLAIQPGVPANLCVVDTTHEWVVAGEEMASRSRNTAFEGETLTGRVRHTVSAGELVVQDGMAQR